MGAQRGFRGSAQGFAQQSLCDFNLERAALDPGGEQDHLDQAREAFFFGEDSRGVLLDFFVPRRLGLANEQFREQAHGGKRRSQLVADGGHEFALLPRQGLAARNGAVKCKGECEHEQKVTDPHECVGLARAREPL